MEIHSNGASHTHHNSHRTGYLLYLGSQKILESLRAGEVQEVDSNKRKSWARAVAEMDLGARFECFLQATEQFGGA